MPRFPLDERRAALIVIPTVARPSVLLPAFERLLRHLDGLPVHICVSINPVKPEDGDASYTGVVKTWRVYAEEGLLPPGSLLTIYRHPGPCGFGGALNRGVLAAATPYKVTYSAEDWCGHENAEILGPNVHWPFDMRPVDGGLVRIDDTGTGKAVDLADVAPGLPPLTIFYNDDLEAASGWLGEMVAAVSPDQTTICDVIEIPKPDGSRVPRPMSLYGKVGIVGPVTNLAAGMQQISPREATAWRRMGTDKFASEWRGTNAGMVTTADFLSGFCLGITRDCLEALWAANPDRDGLYLFDEANYPIAGYEDNDLCVRAAEAGYRAAIAVGSFVGHIGHQSFDHFFADMQRGLRNRANYYAKWAPWVQAQVRNLVAALRVKIEVPHDLRLLRPTLQRLGELVDGVTILFTNNPAEALAHPEGQQEARDREIPPQDFHLMNALSAKGASPRQRLDLLAEWIKSCVTDGARARGRKPPAVSCAIWPDLPMNERDERNAVIQQAEMMGAYWIWAIDHDEVVEPRITRAHLDRWMSNPDPLAFSLDQTYHTTWDSVRLYNLNPPWGDAGTMRGLMRGWRLWRVNRAAPTRILAGTENGLHCGNSPTSDAMTKRHAAIRIYHHGYLRAQDRQRKKARYDQQDPNPDVNLVGGTSYAHLVYEEQVRLSAFMPRCGIGLHMLVHAGEDPGAVMAMLDRLHSMVDAAVLVWTSPPDAPARAAFEQIAGWFGARMIDHPIDPQVGGLGDARNAGMDALAQIEESERLGLGWALFMDPDEQLPDDALPSLRRLADATDCWGWLFEFVNPHLSGDPSQSESIRMVRLDPAMRMDGRVHEGFDRSIRALRAKGYGDIIRRAPFRCLNLGLRVSNESLQVKYDRYFKWASNAIADGEGRATDWSTVGLYFAHEGLDDQAIRCFQNAARVDETSWLSFRDLSVQYLRLAREPAARAASILPQGDPRREHLERIVDLCDQEAPPITGMGTVGQSGHREWDACTADSLITSLEQLHAQARAERMIADVRK